MTLCRDAAPPSSCRAFARHDDYLPQYVITSDTWYDTAQVSNAVTIGALAKLVPVSQIVFGTDYPYRTSADHVKGLAIGFGPDELKAIERDNALRILPHLKTT